MNHKTLLVGLILAAGFTTFVEEANARPRGGSRQGTVTRQRQPGQAQRTYQGTRTGAQGKTSQVNRNNTTQRTGPNTFSREGQQTVTGPNGQQRTQQSQGTGSVQRTENGYSKTYDGTITNDRGKTVDVNRTTDVTKNADGTKSRDSTGTYTNSQGQVIGTGQSNSTYTPGQGTETSKSYTNSQDKTWNYEGQSSQVAPGQREMQGTVTNPQGNSRGVQGRVRWQKIDGKWVKMTEGSTTP